MGSQLTGWDDEFCEQLAERGFWVIRFDNRDVGRSTWLSEAGTPDLMHAMTRAWAAGTARSAMARQSRAARRIIGQRTVPLATAP